MTMTVVSESARSVYQTEYIRNSRAIAVLWGVFTVVFAIINVVAFVQPYWLGDSYDTARAGYFGLFERCYVYGVEVNTLKCQGSLLELDNMPSKWWLIATVAMGVSVVLIFLSIIGLFLFFCLHATHVFRICGVIQILAGMCIIVAVFIYPAGWGAEDVRYLCGESAFYDYGDCLIRWAYILAMVAILDALVLGCLALVLASRHKRLLPEMYGGEGIYSTPNVYGGIGSEYGSRKSQSQLSAAAYNRSLGRNAAGTYVKKPTEAYNVHAEEMREHGRAQGINNPVYIS